MFWNTWEHTARRGSPKKEQRSALTPQQQKSASKSLLNVRSDVKVAHPVWNLPSKRAVPPKPKPVRFRSASKKPVGDPVLHRFFERQRRKPKKKTEPAKPKHEIVAVGHSGAFVITTDRPPARMPDEFYESPAPRKFLSYVAGGDNGLEKRWASDPDDLYDTTTAPSTASVSHGRTTTQAVTGAADASAATPAVERRTARLHAGVAVEEVGDGSGHNHHHGNANANANANDDVRGDKGDSGAGGSARGDDVVDDDDYDNDDDAVDDDARGGGGGGDDNDDDDDDDDDDDSDGDDDAANFSDVSVSSVDWDVRS